MELSTIQNPFKTGFLSSFVIMSETLPFLDKEIVNYDRKLGQMGA